MAAVYWFKYGGKNYVDGGWPTQGNRSFNGTLGAGHSVLHTIDVVPSSTPWNKILLEKSTPNAIWIDVYMTSLDSSQGDLKFTLYASNSGGAAVSNFTNPDGSDGHVRESWYKSSGFWGAWAGNPFSNSSTRYYWTIEISNVSGQTVTIYSSTFRYTIGLGYPVPSAETKVTAAQAQKFAEMLSRRRYSVLDSTYTATAGNAIKPQPYLGAGGYWTNGNIAKDKIIYNARQTEIINYLSGGNTIRSAET